ncbi:MAG: DMT family transporter, partial [Actinomycetota bacterium]
MDAGRQARLGELGLIGIAAIWGLTFVMVQDAIEEIPVMTFLAYRFLPAAAVVAAFSSNELRKLSGGGVRAGLFMGIFLTSGYVCQTLGLERTTASNAGFITGMFVVLTPVFGALFLQQRAGAVAWVAALASTLGLLLLSGVAGALVSRGEGVAHLSGDALVFLCACSFAFHILFTDRGVREHDVRALLVVQLALCGVLSFVIAGANGDLVMPRSGVVWSALAVTAFLASALGFFVQSYAQQHSSPSRTALILASEP